MTPTALMTIALRRAGYNNPGVTDFNIARSYLNLVKTEVETAAKWRFLYLIGTLTTVASQAPYDLAADVLEPLDFWDTSNNRQLDTRNPEDITGFDPDEDNTGDASYVAITGRDTSTGYLEVRVHPTPSSAGDTIKYRYRAFITDFTSSMDATDMVAKYPAWLQNALLWGTAAMIKEEKENSTATFEWEKYSASIKFGMDLNKEQSVPAQFSMGRQDQVSSFRFDMEVVPD